MYCFGCRADKVKKDGIDACRGCLEENSKLRKENEEMTKENEELKEKVKHMSL